MASFVAHFALALLYFIFPGRFDLWALFIGSNLPDLEYFPQIMGQFLRRIKVGDMFGMSRTGFLHSIVGVYFVAYPIMLVAFAIGNAFMGSEFALGTVSFSLLFGVTAHLVMDFPAHRELSLFYPFKTMDSPFVWKDGIFGRMFPQIKNPWYHESTFDWLLFTTVVSVCAVLIYILAI